MARDFLDAFDFHFCCLFDFPVFHKYLEVYEFLGYLYIFRHAMIKICGIISLIFFKSISTS